MIIADTQRSSLTLPLDTCVSTLSNSGMSFLWRARQFLMTALQLQRTLPPRDGCGAHTLISSIVGTPVSRTKMWFQQDVESYHKYSYTGWNNAVAKATYRASSIPNMNKLCDASNELFDKAHNHWIVTKYENGNDCIGLHSDKTRNWVADSAFMVIKLGEARPFQFSKSVEVLDKDGNQKADKNGKKLTKDVVIWEEVLQPGTAVIIGIDANNLVKHGVPPTSDPVGASGSVVGRARSKRKCRGVSSKVRQKNCYKKRTLRAAQKAAAKKRQKTT